MFGIESRRDKMVIGLILGIFLLQLFLALKIRAVEDESWLSIPAYTLLTQGKLAIPVFDTNEREYFVAPPALPIFLASAFKLGGTGLIQGRIVSMFFGVLTLMVFFFLARRLFGASVALVALALLAVDNLHFLASVTIRPEILVTFFTLLALFFIFNFLEKGSSFYTLLAGISVGLGLSTHPHAAGGFISIMFILFLTFKGRTFSNKGLYLFLGGTFLALLPYLLYLLAVDMGSGFSLLKSQVLRRAPGISFRVAEAASPINWAFLAVKKEILERYRDFLMFPYRLPAIMAILGGLAYSFYARRSKQILLASIVGIHLVIFAAMDNKNARYMAIISPYFALLVAVAVCSFLSFAQKKDFQRKLQTIAALALIAAFGVSQLLGNSIYLYKFKNSDYYQFMAELKKNIPEGASVYGTVAYWFGFHDRRYYAYDRVSFESATQRRQPDIYILDDRAMTSQPERRGLRLKLHDYLARNGTLLGQVKNPFYGELKIYQVVYPPGTEHNSSSSKLPGG